MVTLAVDTATKCASAAVIENGEVRSEYLINHRTLHSRNIMTLIDAAVKNAKIDKKNIDLFATTIGPGSFTGVRIGVSTIKAMAYSKDKKTVGINTLDALAHDVNGVSHLICPVIDARNKQVYTAVYRRYDNNVKRITDYMGIKIDKLMDLLNTKKNDVIFTGNAAEICYNLKKQVSFKKYIVGKGKYMPKASTVGLIAENEKPTDPSELVPFYLRKSQAEQMRNKKND